MAEEKPKQNNNNNANANKFEEDEFEEFPAEPVVAKEDEKDTIWYDNWEDETQGEDFSVELRAELKKLGYKAVI
uniref:26S proteasome complex subunit dss-1 n=1 Tax=Panagrolaimus davidi TaxID=227884 RepID=A0A914PYJ1_9BILA